MAYSESPTVISMVAGATFSTADLYKGLVVNSSGYVTLPDTTGDVTVIGTLYGVTSTTASTGVQAVPVATAGVVKVQMAASTLAAGGIVAFSTAGLGIAPTTDAYRFGIIVNGSSGAAGRVHSVQVARGPLNA